MPAVPIPGQANILGASWGSPVQDAMGQAAGAIGQIQSPVLQANNIQQQLAQTNALTGQAANSVQDLNQKQRAFQTSMLNGVLALPPEKQADALAKVVPMMNRMGPTQYDTGMTPAQARMITMANVPTEQLPMYQKNAAIASMFTNAANRQAQQGGQQTPPANNQATPSGPPMPADGNIGGAQPVPQGGGTPLPSDSFLLTDPNAPLYDPEGVKAAAEAKKTQFETDPNQQMTMAAAKKRGEAGVEATQTAQEGQTTTDTIVNNTKNLMDEANQLIKNHPNIANSPVALKVARSYQTNNPNDQVKDIDTGISNLEELSSADLLPSIRSFLKGTGQVRVFEGINLDKIFGYDPDRSLQANMSKWQYAVQQVQLGQQGANNLRKALQTGEIYGLDTSGGKGGNPPKGTSTPNLVPNQTVYKGHLYIGGDPSKQTSWQAQGNQ